MADYRIDATSTGVQQSILYLHNIMKVVSDANVAFFVGLNEMIVATAPIISRIAFVIMGTSNDYRVDTLSTVSQQYEIYLHNISNVLANTDVIFFLDPNGNIVATAPVASRIAYTTV